MLATTTLLLRRTSHGEPYERADDVPFREVAGVLDIAGGSTTRSGSNSDRVEVRATFRADGIVECAAGDTFVDELGQKWTVSRAVFPRGLGLDHTVADLVRVSGVA